MSARSTRYPLLPLEPPPPTEIVGPIDMSRMPVMVTKLAQRVADEDTQAAKRKEMKDSGREPSRKEKVEAIKDALIDQVYEDVKEGRAPSAVDLQRLARAIAEDGDDTKGDDFKNMTTYELDVVIAIMQAAASRKACPEGEEETAIDGALRASFKG